MNSLFKNKPQMILLVIMIIYLMSDIQTPIGLTLQLRSVFGHMILLVVSVYLILRAQPVIAVFGLMTLYEIIKRGQTVPDAENIIVTPEKQEEYLSDIILSEENKAKKMYEMNQFSEIPSMPLSLEEKIIKKRLPLVNKDEEPTNADYKPVLDDKIGYGVL